MEQLGWGGYIGLARCGIVALAGVVGVPGAPGSLISKRHVEGMLVGFDRNVVYCRRFESSLIGA